MSLAAWPVRLCRQAGEPRRNVGYRLNVSPRRGSRLPWQFQAARPTRLGAALRLRVLTSADDNEETVIELGRTLEGPGTAGHGTLRLDQTRSSLDPTVDMEDKLGPVRMPDGRVHLRVLLDRSAVEIFANGKPLTARVYPTLGVSA